MKTAQAPWILALAIGLGGCGGDAVSARDQWLVSVTTDAATPQFGDRLLLEILDEQGEPACAGCRRIIGAPDVWPASFGVVRPTLEGRFFVRGRLYRTRYTGSDGLPLGELVIDGLGELAAPAEVQGAHLHLSMDCFGAPVDPVAKTTCLPGRVEPSSAPLLGPLAGAVPQPGDWPGSERLPCSGGLPDGMKCIAGGTFLMNDPAGQRFLVPGAERLVRLSPYALDADEMTVGEYLALSATDPTLPQPISRGGVDGSYESFCSYDPADLTRNGLPVNCVSREAAAQACSLQGKRLPTEAEFEFAAGNTEKETRFPWGEATNVCDLAVVARGPIGLDVDYTLGGGECREQGVSGILPAGPVVGGSPADLTEDGVLNLGGNVNEWIAGEYADYEAPCWDTQGTVLENPLCSDSGSTLVPIRGSTWGSHKFSASAWARNASGGQASSFTGFRCAKDQ